MRAVLFDNDGTLVDTHDMLLSSYRYALKKVLDLTLPEEKIMAKVGQPLTVQMWDFTSDQEKHDELMEVYRAHNETIHDTMIALFPQVKETLEVLQKRGFKLGVVTSKRHELAWHGLEVLGISSCFSALVGYGDCDAYKPSPEPVLMGCDLLGCMPSQAIYVGDSPFDVQAGNSAGLTTVAALWGMFSRDVLAAQNPDYFASRFDELLALPPFMEH